MNRLEKVCQLWQWQCHVIYSYHCSQEIFQCTSMFEWFLGRQQISVCRYRLEPIKKEAKNREIELKKIHLKKKSQICKKLRVT